MRIVITGASGNVETALLRALPAEHDVVGVVRRLPPPHGAYRRVDWRALDLTDSDAISTLHAVFEGADVVVHLAWGFQPTRDGGAGRPPRRRCASSPYLQPAAAAMLVTPAALT